MEPQTSSTSKSSSEAQNAIYEQHLLAKLERIQKSLQGSTTSTGSSSGPASRDDSFDLEDPNYPLDTGGWAAGHGDLELGQHPEAPGVPEGEGLQSLQAWTDAFEEEVGLDYDEEEEEPKMPGARVQHFTDPLNALDAIRDIRGQRQFWLDCQMPDPATLRLLANQFPMHPLTVEDITNADSQQEKAEAFVELGCHVAVLTELRYSRGTNDLRRVNVILLLYADCAVSFHRFPAEDAVTDRVAQLVDAAESEADLLDQLVLQFSKGARTDMLKRIGALRKILALLHSQLLSKARLTIELLKSDRFSDHTRTFLRDVEDHVQIMQAEVGIIKDLMQSLDSTYMAKVSLDQADAADRVNEVMKKFSAIATMFVPLSLVAGLFGMNVKVPGQTVDSEWYPVRRS